MEELLKSFGEWFKERTTSPLYGTFIASVILWNWKFFYILFWQDENKLLVPKIEYIQAFLHEENAWAHILYFLVLPALSSYILIWWLPILSNLAHEASVRFHFARKKFFDEASVRGERETKNTLDVISELKEGQAEAKKIIEKNTTEEEKWTIDYEAFKKRRESSYFPRLVKLVYGNSGYVDDVPPEILAFFDSWGLVELSERKNHATLTGKGTYFVRLMDSGEKSEETPARWS